MSLLRQQLASDRLKECARNDASLGELTQADLDAIDAAYHLKKVSGELRKRDDEQAVLVDLQWLDFLRRNKAI